MVYSVISFDKKKFLINGYLYNRSGTNYSCGLSFKLKIWSTTGQSFGSEIISINGKANTDYHIVGGINCGFSVSIPNYLRHGKFFIELYYRSNKIRKATYNNYIECSKIDKGQKWYGRVNYWSKYAVSENEIVACKTAKIKYYAIELFSWQTCKFPSSYYTKDNKVLDNITKKYRDLLCLCRKYGLGLFVSICNDNIGSGKYGDANKGRYSNNSVIQKYMQWGNRLVSTYGLENVLVQPVAETYPNTGGSNLENYSRNNLKKNGFKLVNNNNKGQPKGSNKMDYVAYHPASIDTSVNSSYLCVSDYGYLLSQLGIMGDGSIDKSNGLKFYKKNKGCKCVCIYQFARKKYDKDTIKAIKSW